MPKFYDNFEWEKSKTNPRWRYKVTRDYHFQTHIYGQEINQPFSRLRKDGWATLKVGFRWNGANWPAINTDNSVRASAKHDLGYQWLTQGLISAICKPLVDRVWFYATLIADGMQKARARLWLFAVTTLGSLYIKKEKEVIAEKLGAKTLEDWERGKW